jgi:hypothetical protein
MMCYAIGVCNHYFSAEQIPEYNSTDDFLRCHLPAVIWSNTQQQVYVFFHQYLSIKSCKPAMYNHFASPIPEPHCSGAVQTFNAEVGILVKPWWGKVYGVNGYDCSRDVKVKKRNK